MDGFVSVAFICTHNACRSQMAEAFACELASDVLEVYSAGTNPADAINPDAVWVLREKYGLDTTHQHPKTLGELPPVDVVVTMGCGVDCPNLFAAYQEDWGLEDPSDKGQQAMLETAEIIRRRVLDLRCRALAGAFDRKRLASNLKILGDERRLKIVELLADGDEHCACRLLEDLDISQPTLSHHMAALCGTGLVSARREGRWMRYRLDQGVLDALSHLVAQIAG